MVFTKDIWITPFQLNRTLHIYMPDTIYKEETEQKIYQWNTAKMKYELLSDGASAIDIEIIHGGNANGTT